MPVLFAPTRATHTTLECRDIERSLRFYREVMGLPSVRRLKMAGIFRASNGVIAASVQVPRFTPQPFYNFYARPVRDRAEVDRVHARLIAAQAAYGIQQITEPAFEDPGKFGVGTYGFYVLDPDGNWWRVEDNDGPFGPAEIPSDAEPAGSLVPAGPISYVTLESVDVGESVRFFHEFLGLDAESHGHYFFSRGNGGVNVVGVQVADMQYPQPLLNHHGITLYSGREALIDELRESASGRAADFGVMKILPATYQHGSYSFYMQDRDTNWWEIEILEELDPYEQTLKDGEWTEETSVEQGARFARTRHT
ncbi:MAG: VOC family protein [Chloroflexi bacterium]|nr:VOC family protein [Chloroflexota bacterium]